MLTVENARREFMSACLASTGIDAKIEERQRLLHILQSNHDSHVRDILATCMNETDVIEAFTFAGFENDLNLLQAFYDVGMDINGKDKNGATALWRCSDEEGQQECVRWLLDHGANVDIQNNDGWTPLMWASVNERTEVLEMLFEKNANPDIQSQIGWTALMLASSNDKKEVVKCLLNHHANIDLKDEDGKTALDLTTNEEIKEMLQNHVNTGYILK